MNGVPLKLKRSMLDKFFKNVWFAMPRTHATTCPYCLKDDCRSLITDNKKDCKFFKAPEDKVDE